MKYSVIMRERMLLWSKQFFFFRAGLAMILVARWSVTCTATLILQCLWSDAKSIAMRTSAKHIGLIISSGACRWRYKGARQSGYVHCVCKWNLSAKSEQRRTHRLITEHRGRRHGSGSEAEAYSQKAEQEGIDARRFFWSQSKGALT